MARPMRSKGGRRAGFPGGKWLTANTVRDRRARSRAILEHGIASQGTGVVAVLIAGADHQQAKANDVGERVGDQVRRARSIRQRRADRRRPDLARPRARPERRHPTTADRRRIGHNGFAGRQ